jgi:hypothetical protein
VKGGAVNAPTRRLQLLFLSALLGVLGCAGLVVAALAGARAAGAYAVAVVVLLVLGARRARAAQAGARPSAGLSEDGRSCTCCTSSRHDPVKVV